MRQSRSFALAFALCAVLFSCAKKPLLQADCSAEQGRSRALKDVRSARGPDLSFLQGCSDESRNAALSAYRDSFEAAKARKGKGEPEADAEADTELEALKAPSVLPAREPATEAWVCEIEANSKIFTGTGISRDEALMLAKKTCGSHFTSSYCTESNCKKSM